MSYSLGRTITPFILLLWLIIGAPVIAAEQDSTTDDVTAAKETAAATADKLKENQAAIEDKKKEIADLDQRISELQNRSATAAGQAEIIAKQLAAIRQRLEKAQLELQQTQYELTDIITETNHTVASIEDLKSAMDDKRSELKHLIQLLYKQEQRSLITIFLTTGNLSDVLQERATLQELQSRSADIMQDLQTQQKELEQKQANLETQQQELVGLQNILAIQENELTQNKTEQANFLAAKKEEQIHYQQKITEASAARREIEQGLFALKGAGVQLSLAKATDMAIFAGRLTDVRPALLLGVLKVESNMGNNLGNGVYPDDMHPASREAFLRVAEKLGRKPRDMPISAAPSYGWGGAMGPAQIMPQTWERIEPQLAGLLAKPLPDPYEMTDAFVATALLLAQKGATNPATEHEAVGRYLAGPNWAKYPWYIDRVYAVAKEYETQGL